MPTWRATALHDLPSQPVSAAADDPPDTDPLDLDAFRRNGYELIDWVADYLAGLEQRPVVEPVQPGEVRAKLPESAPEQPEPFGALLADLDRVVLPGMAHWQHPNWFAFFPAMSSPASILGELAAAGLGAQGMMWSTSPALTEVESHVLDWLVDLCGAPQSWKSTGSGGGAIQTSASDSTFTALVAAREQCRRRSGAPLDNMVAYASTQAHSSLPKGARAAGYGHVRLIDVDDRYALRPEALQSAIEADLRAGLDPAFACASIGSTATTAVDPLRAMGELAAQHCLWLHVDAAYAGSAMICEEFRRHQDGLELAHSYTFNPHKWLFTNFDCSVLWVADRQPLLEALQVSAPYLRNSASDSGAVIDYRDWQLPLGRRFRALKLWWVLRSHGAEALRERIRETVRWAGELAEWVEARPELEQAAPHPFALVCFAHRDGADATRSLASCLNSAGEFLVTLSEIDDSVFIRVSVGSTWTRHRHVQRLRERLEELLAGGLRADDAKGRA